MAETRKRKPPTERGSPRCDALRLDGFSCRGARLAGSRFCFAHDPAAGGARETAHATGAANARRYFVRQREKRKRHRYARAVP